MNRKNNSVSENHAISLRCKNAHFYKESFS